MDDLEAELAELEAEELDNQLLEPAPVPAGVRGGCACVRGRGGHGQRRQAGKQGGREGGSKGKAEPVGRVLQCAVAELLWDGAKPETSVRVVGAASAPLRLLHSESAPRPPVCCLCVVCVQARRPQPPSPVSQQARPQQHLQRRRRSWSWKHCRQRWRSNHGSSITSSTGTGCSGGSSAVQRHRQQQQQHWQLMCAGCSSCPARERSSCRSCTGSRASFQQGQLCEGWCAVASVP